jgi:hypothetical protein
MKDIEFKKTKKPRLKGTRSKYPDNHPLLYAIQTLNPDSDECLEIPNLDGVELQGLQRRMKEILPDNFTISYRSGPMDYWRDEEGNLKSVETRTIWLVTKDQRN